MENKRYITLSLTADTQDELSIMTANTQVNWDMTLKFFDFSQRKDGKFICWFNVPIQTWNERQSIDG